ncbi:MAG: hypothetical protein K0Q76_3401 [Panacagrimonas sp.]|jgi:hypothetical protein|nr:class I SAM-dependent methyltransferase [Panacagrimonas sp.]MCC2658293.1 hypothetical protein [Panacagrimonas sp.]
MDDPARLLNHSARRINRLAEMAGAHRYLEVGVQAGATFHAVKIPRRVGVDPKFAFDTAQYAGADTQFHAMTSDAYFSQLSFDERFDIVFIDGLHTFEQALRDFHNAVVHGHADSIWIIDDTVPIDAYSAHRNQKEAVAVRRRERRQESAAWHGDVYKLVFALHDFFPAFDYCTICTGGNPQTLAWLEKNPRKPLFNDLERICRLDYFEFTRHMEILNPVSEAEGLARMERFFHSRGSALDLRR